MPSTTVSIAGNVLRTRSVRTPGSKGVYRFGSNVSVCAIPPAIHRTMMESAVASGPAARTTCGSRPTSAARDAAAVTPIPINPRRLSLAMIDFSSTFMERSPSESTETRASSVPPTTGRRVRRPMASGKPVRALRLPRSAAPLRSAPGPAHTSTRGPPPRRRSRAWGRMAAVFPGPAERSRSMLGFRSKTKKRACTLSPVMSGMASKPAAPRKRVNPFPAMS